MVLSLSVFTIVYNVVEGLVSIWLGFRDETLALFGFGVDSFIEVISGVDIAVMAALVAAKERVGRQLNPAAIRADANCTRVCIYRRGCCCWPAACTPSPAGRIWTRWARLAWFSGCEGRESLEKAAPGAVCGCGHD